MSATPSKVNARKRLGRIFNMFETIEDMQRFTAAIKVAASKRHKVHPDELKPLTFEDVIAVVDEIGSMNVRLMGRGINAGTIGTALQYYAEAMAHTIDVHAKMKKAKPTEAHEHQKERPDDRGADRQAARTEEGGERPRKAEGRGQRGRGRDRATGSPGNGEAGNNSGSGQAGDSQSG